MVLRAIATGFRSWVKSESAATSLLTFRVRLLIARMVHDESKQTIKITICCVSEWQWVFRMVHSESEVPVLRNGGPGITLGGGSNNGGAGAGEQLQHLRHPHHQSPHLP